MLQERPGWSDDSGLDIIYGFAAIQVNSLRKTTTRWYHGKQPQYFVISSISDQEEHDSQCDCCAGVDQKIQKQNTRMFQMPLEI